MPKAPCRIHRPNRWNGMPPIIDHWGGRRRLSILTLNWLIGMDYLPFSGYWWDSTWTRGTFPRGSIGPLIRDVRRTKVRKPKVGEKSSVKHLAALESEMMRDHMAVLEALAMLQYADGTPRKAGFLGIFTDGEQWCCFVKDNTGQCRLPARGRTWDDMMDCLTLLLEADAAPWEPDDLADRVKSRRKKD